MARHTFSRFRQIARNRGTMLTGQHRIVHAISFTNAQGNSKVAKFVKVG
jgi:hypothetical protein